jgi:TetR/AcrR family transcriptional regulator, mexJK operon transcriptional repressor
MARPRPHIVRRIPRGETRRMELAGVAERLFLKHGFAETTMQMIASEAGGSKETLYRHFASKQALFAELIGTRAAAIAGPQSAFARDDAPEKVLMGLGMSLMQLVSKRDAASLLSIVVAEAHRAPELAGIFYSRGPGATLQRLTGYLRSATRRRQLRCPDPQRAAKLFLGAVVAQHHLHGLIGQPAKPVTKAEMRKHVRAAVEMFLSHFAI